MLGCRTGRIRAIGAVYIAIFLTAVHFYFSPLAEFDATTTWTALSPPQNDWENLQGDLGEGNATLFLRLRRPRESPSPASDNVAVAVGEHFCQVVVHTKRCPYPQFWIRLVGDALVALDLVQGTDGQNDVWRGKFVIPLEGVYAVDVRWLGCGPDSLPWKSLPIRLASVGARRERQSEKSFWFSNGAWIATRKFEVEASTALLDYIWSDPSIVGQREGMLDLVQIESKDLGIRTVVSKRGVLHPIHGMFKFDENGNYELVCFWGGPSVWTLWQIFLLERRFVSPHQRPFKFHYYNVTNLLQPDKDWPLKEKQRSRKCKHIFVSVDELAEPLSQAAFKEQVTTFVHHLVIMLDNPTFPIWILTAIVPAMSTTNCHTAILPRSTDHPCNDVVKHLFRSPSNQFPYQVHLMDNSDLVMPKFDENRQDILANIAMRVFVAVGKGVADWRAMGQQGLVDGLHRNGTVEPNPELFPYEGWNP
jgi:hypothetical protein